MTPRPNWTGELVIELLDLYGPATTATIIDEVTTRRPVSAGAVRRLLHRYAAEGIVKRCGRIPVQVLDESRGGRFPRFQNLWRLT